METKTQQKLKLALEHAMIIAKGNKIHAENFMFRCGPCDVCGGDCLCISDNNELEKRLLTGKKPVGSFPYESKEEALTEISRLKKIGIESWYGQNKWNMWIVVAALKPDECLYLNGNSVGTPRELSFTYKFINEELPFPIIGLLYGYSG